MLVIPAARADEEGAALLTQFLQGTDFVWSQDTGGATESQAFYLHLDNDEFYFIQIVYNSIGLVCW